MQQLRDLAMTPKEWLSMQLERAHVPQTHFARKWGRNSSYVSRRLSDKPVIDKVTGKIRKYEFDEDELAEVLGTIAEALKVSPESVIDEYFETAKDCATRVRNKARTRKAA